MAEAKPPRDDGGAVDYTKDFFHKPAFLTVSGQLQVESFCCSLGNVYTFGNAPLSEGFNLSSDGKRLVVVSCLDNLMKGAAGQAGQNMNVMWGFGEEEGLH